MIMISVLGEKHSFNPTDYWNKIRRVGAKGIF
jgi:hypothetical protein